MESWCLKINNFFCSTFRSSFSYEQIFDGKLFICLFCDGYNFFFQIEFFSFVLTNHANEVIFFYLSTDITSSEAANYTS